MLSWLPAHDTEVTKVQIKVLWWYILHIYFMCTSFFVTTKELESVGMGRSGSNPLLIRLTLFDHLNWRCLGNTYSVPSAFRYGFSVE